jgi:hypothetical protein
MNTEIPKNLSVGEAITLLGQIRRACPDVNFRVITTDDILGICVGEDVATLLTDDERQQAEDYARWSYEMKDWADMSDFDWDSLTGALPHEFVMAMRGKYEAD